MKKLITTPELEDLIRQHLREEISVSRFAEILNQRLEEKKDTILHKLIEIENEYPFKVEGYPDTYAPYNEGWSDCVDRFEQMLRHELEEDE